MGKRIKTPPPGNREAALLQPARRTPRTWTLEEVRASTGVDARSVAFPRTTVTAKGDVANRDLPESGQRTIDDATTTTLVWGGTYAALEAVQPAKGDLYIAYPNLPVFSSTLVPRRGNLGQLTIILSSRVEESGENPTELKDRWEIEWREVEKSLLQHTYIADDAAVADIIEDIELWKNSDAKLRAQYKYTDEAGAEQTLAGKALAVATKIQRGQENYIVFAPAMRRIRDYQGRPDPAVCGFIEVPTINIAGYIYLKTGDRLVQQADDAWQRTEEWSGADAWDPDLYTTGAGWNA